MRPMIPISLASKHKRTHLGMVKWPGGEALGLIRLPKFADEVPVGIQRADGAGPRKRGDSFVASIHAAEPTGKVFLFSRVGASVSAAP